jgi:hypothetical protein
MLLVVTPVPGVFWVSCLLMQLLDQDVGLMTSNLCNLCTLSAVPSCRYAGGHSPTRHSCLDSVLLRHTPALMERSLQCCTGTGPANSLHIQEEYFVLHERFKTVVSIYTVL